MSRKPKLFSTLLIAAMLMGYEATAFAADPAHGEEVSGSVLLSPDLGSYIWKIIIFTVFLIVLSIFVWPPILKGLQAREAKQLGDLKSAEDAAAEAQKTLVAYKQQLAEAQKEAQRIIDESRSQAQQVAAQVKAQAETDAKSLRERNVAEINAAKEQAIAEVYAQTAELSTQIAAKILGKQIDVADQQALVNQSLQELTQLNRN